MKENNKIDDFKREYENIEIPQELSQIVQGSIDKALIEVLAEEENCKGRKTVDISKERAKRVKTMKRKVMGVAAAAVIMIGGFGVGVNTNEAFAASMENIPVLGSLAKIFTIESVHEETDVYVADLKIPGVEGLNNPELEKKFQRTIPDTGMDEVGSGTTSHQPMHFG